MSDLKINKRLDGDTLVVALVGKVTANNAEEILKSVNLDYNLFTNILVDGADLDYISSAGLRQIRMMITITGKKGGKTRVTNIREDVMEILEMTGFLGVMEVV